MSPPPIGMMKAPSIQRISKTTAIVQSIGEFLDMGMAAMPRYVHRSGNCRTVIATLRYNIVYRGARSTNFAGSRFG